MALSTIYLGFIPTNVIYNSGEGTAMLTTGNQLKAARALLEMEQGALAEAAGVNINTVRNLEASKGEPIRGHNQTVVAVQAALEAAGIEFLNHGQPGVRLRANPPPAGKRKK
jgi:transcriptional regulator with XRE-family HTH domain